MVIQATPRLQTGVLCARELKVTLSVGSLGIHLRECAPWTRIDLPARRRISPVRLRAPSAISPATQRPRQQAASARRQARRRTYTARPKDAAREATDAAVSYAKDAYENSGDTFRDGSQAMAKKVQDNPLGSMLIAGGIGFALALLMTRPPRRPPPRRW